MTMIEGLLAELEQESLTTRRVLERVPQAHLSWKPHPKSWSLGQLALHIAARFEYLNQIFSNRFPLFPMRRFGWPALRGFLH